MVKVFDDEFIASLPQLQRFNDNAVVFLCRSSDSRVIKCRQDIENWYLQLPSSDQADVRSRLRSTDEIDHISAFFELLFHEYLRQRNFGPARHVPVEGGCPDLLATRFPNKALILEVVTLLDTQVISRGKRFLYQLARRLDRPESNFYLSLHLSNWPRAGFSLKLLDQKISSWLQSLDHNIKNRVSTLIHHEDIKLDLDAWPRLEKSPLVATVASIGYPVQDGAGTNMQIKRAIEKKINKYKGVKVSGQPFVVVVSTEQNFMVDEQALERILFGQFKVTWYPDLPDQPSELGRDFSGIFTPKPTLGRPRNTRLSGVILCWRDFSKDRPMYNMRLFHNPWAACPLRAEDFQDLKQLVPDKSSDGGVSMSWKEPTNPTVLTL